MTIIIQKRAKIYNTGRHGLILRIMHNTYPSMHHTLSIIITCIIFSLSTKKWSNQQMVVREGTEWSGTMELQGLESARFWEGNICIGDMCIGLTLKGLRF
jgi:hypothetical protein